MSGCVRGSNRHDRIASLSGNFLVAIAEHVFYGTFHKRFILNSLKSIEKCFNFFENWYLGRRIFALSNICSV